MSEAGFWVAVGAIGEIVGAVAVVATLLYLARQVNENSTQVKLNTSQSFASLTQDAFAPIYNSADTLRIFNAGLENPSSLTADELKTFYFFMDRLLNNIGPLLAHHNAAVMSDSEFRHYRELYLEMIRSPGGQQWKLAKPRSEFNRMLLDLENANP